MVKTIPTITELFKSGAHFGHRRNHTDARSHQFVYSYRNRVAVINLEKTIGQIETALVEIKARANDSAVFLFVGTKLQAKEVVKKTAEELNSPYIIERWPGGLLTNFDVIIKGIRKMNKTEQDLAENNLSHLKKKEILHIEKNLAKQKTVFGGLKNLEAKPDVLVVVDAKQEEIAVAEARKGGIEVIAICDTNSNPKIIDFPIVANDDSRKTIELIMSLIADGIKANFKPKAEASEDKIEERLSDKVEAQAKEKEALAKTKEPVKEVEKETKKPVAKVVKKSTKEKPKAKTAKKTVKPKTKTKKN